MKICNKKIEKAQKILKEIKKKGFEVFIVGGAVRDIILNISVNDVDIITNGRYEEISKFLICHKKNIKYGSFQIIFEKEKFETTTYRKEGPYLDHRNPSFVEFISDIKEDLKRRDFTINGFLMNENREIIDYVNGFDDLNKKQIKTIGEPYQKLTEDALRMMRIFTLQAKSNFEIEIETKKILKKNIFLLNKIPLQEIIKELKKITKQKFFKKALISLKETNAISFLKEFKESIIYIIKENLTKMNPELFLDLSFILNHNIINSFPFSKKEKKRFKKLISLYKLPTEYTLLKN
ncbi:CCA tRNA nucleotidyltransferase [Candidatus Phytoplasma rubi]|uniref:CCA tRNA nucleotidyltransferase n=1 Tax=Candidatus Phytoplasma rubi TaxID=399025 RepID=A0ABY7BSZ9_9MOLU|nr:CCA tRNA nucleotidyltransferase [Candidatus Phytoplasma rubi]WAN63286.1 CCA tRNA nucleotidyltransferase [Candidatus Phytoplasma rubi]